MISRELICEYILDEVMGATLLAKALLVDEMANGIQYVGSENVEKIALGVSFNEAFLHEAVQWGANMCIFHHGIDPRTHKSVYPNYAQKRMNLVAKHNLTIAGFHASLDMHPDIGNNVQIIKKLGAKVGKSIYHDFGYIGHFNKPQDLSELLDRCSTLFDHEILSFESGTERIKTIGVVSGAGKPYAQEIQELQDEGVQLYISGESSESTPHKLLESNINYFVCGHYATEVFGVKALGKLIQEKFDAHLDVKFIDIPNFI